MCPAATWMSLAKQPGAATTIKRPQQPGSRIIIRGSSLAVRQRPAAQPRAATSILTARRACHLRHAEMLSVATKTARVNHLNIVSCWLDVPG